MGGTISCVNSMLQGGDPDLPLRQKWLREACVTGDVGKVQRLLYPKACKWHRWLTCVLAFGDQEPASMDFIYVDDRGRQPLHYVASGVPRNHHFIEPLYNVPDTTIRGKHQERRAQLLAWLLEEDVALDVNAVDMRGKSVVQWAVLSQSLLVLEVLIRVSRQQGIALDVTSPDHADTSALDIALASQQWSAVQLLIQSGALAESKRLKDAAAALAEFAPDVTIGAAGASSPRLQADAPWTAAVSSYFSSMVASLFPAAPISQPYSARLPKVESHVSVASVEDEEGEPPCEDGLLHSCEAPQVFSSMQEVEEFWDAQARHLSSVCSLDLPTAHRLLKSHAHDVDAAIRSCLLKSDDAAACGGDASASPQPSFRQCIVCYEDIRPGKQPQIELPCSHATCVNCWQSYIRARLEEGQACSIQCPEPGCSMMLPLAEARRVLPAPLYGALQQAVLQSYVDSNPNIKWCPRPGCGNSISLAHELQRRNIRAADLAGTALAVRCKCGYSFCWHCLEESHEPALCCQVKNWRSMLEEEKKDCEHQTSTWMQHNTQRCCNCGCHVQRSDGCNHMKCTVCGQHFCYVCGQDWASHGPQTGGFYACTVSGHDKAAGGSFFSLLAENVTLMIQKAFKFLTRQEMYMRRYVAQLDDNAEVNRVLQHILRILVAGLPAAADDAGRPKADEDRTPPSRARSQPPDRADRAVVAAAERAQDVDAVDPEAAENDNEDEVQALADDERGDGVAGGRRADAALSGDALAAAVKAAEAAADASARASSPPAPPGRQPPGLAARVPSIECFLREWERTVAQGRQVLRNTYIATYFMERCNERQHLESLQLRLESQVGQLAALLSRMPHRRDILEREVPAGGGGGGRAIEPPGGAGGASVLVRCVLLVLQMCGRAVLCLGQRLLSLDSYGGISLMSLPGHQVRDQFYYVMTLYLHRARIVRLLRQVNRTCQSIVRAGRNKHHSKLSCKGAGAADDKKACGTK